MNKYIAVAYKLYTVENDETHLVEEAPASQPFQFISGFGVSLDAFERNIVDLAKGEEFDFTLCQDEAFGGYDEARVLDLDREMFTINGHFDHERIYIGAFVPMQNEDGNHFQAQVLEINDTTVKMDFNSPLAGKNLRFVGQMIESREATADEIQGLIARLSGGGCSCGCGDCGGGCDSGCNSHHHGDGCGCGCH